MQRHLIFKNGEHTKQHIMDELMCTDVPTKVTCRIPNGVKRWCLVEQRTEARWRSRDQRLARVTFTQLQEHWGIDEEWMSPELLRGRAKEMEHMKMHGVFVSWKTKNAPSTKTNRIRSKWVDGLEGDGCRSRIVVTEIELGKTKDTQPGTEVDYSAVHRSKEEKTLTTCPMTEGDSTHKLSALAAWGVPRAHVYACADGVSTRHYRKVTSNRESWHGKNGVCSERKKELKSAVTCGPRSLRTQLCTWDKLVLLRSAASQLG